MAALNETLTVICPALPVNGRTVYQGYLFVGEHLLSESGMRHHPVTPMTDSNLLRLMACQSTGKAGLIPLATVDQGAGAITEQLEHLRAQGVNYAVIDTLTEQHLLNQGEALTSMRLVTGAPGWQLAWRASGQHLAATMGRRSARATRRGSGPWCFRVPVHQ